MVSSRLVVFSCYLSLLGLSAESSTDPPAACRQLGCDSPGSFSQASFKVPSSQPKLAWKSKRATTMKMKAESLNYGCIASNRLAVCPIRDKAEQPVRYLMLNPNTGEEYVPDGYDLPVNVSMPILTKEDRVFSVNMTHVTLVDPWKKTSTSQPLPQPFQLGVLSPLYFPQLNYYLVVGNLSDFMYIYKLDESANKFSLLTQFSVNKTGSDCGFTTVAEVAANGNRIYFYGLHISGSIGVVAVDLMKDAPYYKKAWDATDPGASEKTSPVSSEKNNLPGGCIQVPDMGPSFAWFPPDDVQTQLLATPDGYVVVTLALGLIVFKDNGDSAKQITGMLWGAHFLALDHRPLTSEKPVVWMTGWGLYPYIRLGVMGFNYRSADTSTAIWSVFLPNVTDASGDANITSRITSFPDPQHNDKQILVFGASLATKDKSDWLHRHLPESADTGIHKVVMAIRTQYKSVDRPDIVWITPIQSTSNELEVRGQIVGALDKLIMYVGTDTSGYVMAIQ